MGVVGCYSPQPECDRPAQLAALQARLAELTDAPVYVEQSADDRRFNRGALLNYGALAAFDAGASAVVLVRLLPSGDLRQWYTDARAFEQAPVHIATEYQRYQGPRFFGGIVGMSPYFLAANSFPIGSGVGGGKLPARRLR